VFCVFTDNDVFIPKSPQKRSTAVFSLRFRQTVRKFGERYENIDLFSEKDEVKREVEPEAEEPRIEKPPSPRMTSE